MTLCSLEKNSNRRRTALEGTAIQLRDLMKMKKTKSTMIESCLIMLLSVKRLRLLN